MLKKLASKVSPPKEIKRLSKPEYDDSEIGDYFKSAFSGSSSQEKLAALVLKNLFGTIHYKVRAEELFSNVKNSKAVCAKIFTKNDIAFRCLDCEKDPTCVICKECYEKGNHKGHRVVMNKYVSGCCDCGDPDAWNEAGFCSDHPGYAKFKPTYSVNDIPEEFRE